MHIRTRTYILNKATTVDSSLEKKILLRVWSIVVPLLDRYRGQVNTWVKESVAVFFLKLHRRGERGRKGRGGKISKQRTPLSPVRLCPANSAHVFPSCSPSAHARTDIKNVCPAKCQPPPDRCLSGHQKEDYRQMLNYSGEIITPYAEGYTLFNLVSHLILPLELRLNL